MKKKKFFGKLAMMLTSALLIFSLASCGKDGTTGPQGPAGEQGAQGESGAPGKDGAKWLVGVVSPDANVGIEGDFYLNTATLDIYSKAGGVWNNIGNLKGDKGNDADPDTLAFVVFNPESEGEYYDPIIVDKGEKLTLPENPKKYGYDFDGWWHITDSGETEITEDTVINENMTLVAKWDPKMILYSSSDGVAMTDEAYLYYIYPTKRPVNVKLEKIVRNGTEYTVDEAIDAGIFEGKYSYDTSEPEYSYDGEFTGEYNAYFGFDKSGDYTVYLSYGEDSLSADIHVRPVSFYYDFEVLTFTPASSSVDEATYAPGNVVTYNHYGGETGILPKHSYDIEVRAPKGFEYSITLNGESVSATKTSKGNDTYVLNVDAGVPDAAVTKEYVWVVTLSHEDYGVVSGNLTVKLGTEEAPVTPTISQHDFTKIVKKGDTFKQQVQWYGKSAAVTLPEWTTITYKLTDEAGVEKSVSVNSNTDATYWYVNVIESTFDTSSLSVGKYTLTTIVDIINPSDGSVYEEIPDFVSEFFVAPNSIIDEDAYTSAIIGIPQEFTHVINDKNVVSVTIEGVTIALDETKEIPYDKATVNATLRRTTDGNTTLIVLEVVGKEVYNGSRDNLFDVVINNGFGEYTLAIKEFDIISEEYVRASLMYEIVPVIYSLETYFGSYITSENSAIKALYDAINIDYDSMSVIEIENFLYSDEVDDLFYAAMGEMDTLVWNEEKTALEYLEAARIKVLSATKLPTDLIMIFDNMAMIQLFDESYTPDNFYLDLFDIGTAEGGYIAFGDRGLVDMFYIQMTSMSGSVPTEIQIMLNAITNARNALLEAESAGAENVSELEDAYVESFIDFFDFVYGGFPIIRVI